MTSDLKWGALETLLLKSLYLFGNIGVGLSTPQPPLLRGPWNNYHFLNIFSRVSSSIRLIYLILIFFFFFFIIVFSYFYFLFFFAVRRPPSAVRIRRPFPHFTESRTQMSLPDFFHQRMSISRYVSQGL